MRGFRVSFAAAHSFWSLLSSVLRDGGDPRDETADLPARRMTVPSSLAADLERLVLVVDLTGRYSDK